MQLIKKDLNILRRAEHSNTLLRAFLQACLYAYTLRTRSLYCARLNTTRALNACMCLGLACTCVFWRIHVLALIGKVLDIGYGDQV